MSDSVNRSGMYGEVGRGNAAPCKGDSTPTICRWRSSGCS